MSPSIGGVHWAYFLMFHIFSHIFDALIMGALILERLAPPQGYRFPRESKGLACKNVSDTHSAPPEATPPTISSMNSHSPMQYSPCPKSPQGQIADN